MDQKIKQTAVSDNSYTFARKVWVTVGIVAVVFITLYLLWFAAKDVLAIFGGILLAVFLNGAADQISARTFLSRKGALVLTVVILLSLAALLSFLLIPNLSAQGKQLGQALRDSVGALEGSLSGTLLGQPLLDQFSGVSENPSSILSRVSSVFSNIIDVGVRLVIILFVGFYLTYEPRTYMEGLLKLLPQERRPRFEQSMDKAAYAVRWWLVGQLASMTVVGVLSIIGLMILDVPLALILGLLAGLLAFIPLLGPTLALVPPLLIAIMDTPQKALYVFLLYMAIQFVESYLLTPLTQRRVSALPPVLLIASQVILSLLAGWIGIMMAAPLAVVGLVLVKMLFVEGVIHDHSVEYLEDTRRKRKEEKEIKSKSRKKTTLSINQKTL